MHAAKNSCCEALVGCVFQSQNWAAKAVASAVVRMSCSLWEHAAGCEREVRGFFAFLPGSSRDTCTHFTPPERALLRVKGFCGASGEATACGVNLYEDMSCLLTKRGSKQHKHRSKWTKISDMSSVQQTWVFQIALFKGFPNIPHIPLPMEHSVGTNEATIAPTAENPESWHIPHRPREILHSRMFNLGKCYPRHMENNCKCLLFGAGFGVALAGGLEMDLGFMFFGTKAFATPSLVKWPNRMVLKCSPSPTHRNRCNTCVHRTQCSSLSNSFSARCL